MRAPAEHTPMSLGAGFPTISHEEWQDRVARALNASRAASDQLDGPAAEAALRTTLDGGLVVDPLYPRSDRPLGVPGRMPFTRGRGLRDPDQPWDVRAFHDDPDPVRGRAAVRDDLENGVTSLWVQVGTDGVAVDDLAEMLADVRFEVTGVLVSSATHQVRAAEALVDLVAGRASVGGNLGVDPIAAALRLGATPDLTSVVDAVDSVAGRAGWRALTIDTGVLHDAGATDVDALAVGVATAVAYLRQLRAQGRPATVLFRQVQWRVRVTADQFLAAAVLRGLRRVWARVGEVCGVPEVDRGAVIHAVTSLRMTTLEDPFTNVLRHTLAAFGATIGGADAVTVLPYDTASGLPESFSRRLARNTQLLLADEANVGRVTDPGGGSWYLEHLTDDLAQAVWSRFQEIERAGGIERAIAAGLVHDWVAAAVTTRDRDVAACRRPVVGTSVFPDPTCAPAERRARVILPGSARALVPRRDAEPFERLRARARAAEPAPVVQVRTLGSRREFGPRLSFVENALAAGGIGVVETPAPVAVIASSPAGYAQHGADAVARVRAEGADRVLIAGPAAQLGDGAAVDGELLAGSDLVAMLEDILDRLGVPASQGSS